MPDNLILAQDVERTSANRWRWSVWLVGPNEILDQVRHVVYLLHPTFKEPVRPVSDRSTAFRLTSAGWGDFTIRARVFFESGEETLLTHRLRLHDERGPETAPSVFLSYGSADREIADRIRGELQQRGIRIVDPVTAPALLVSEAVESALDEVNAVFVIYGLSRSPNVIFEAGFARALGKPVIIAFPAETSAMLPSDLHGLQYYRDYDDAIVALERALAAR